MHENVGWMDMEYGNVLGPPDSNTCSLYWMHSEVVVDSLTVLFVFTMKELPSTFPHLFIHAITNWHSLLLWSSATTSPFLHYISHICLDCLPIWLRQLYQPEQVKWIWIWLHPCHTQHIPLASILFTTIQMHHIWHIPVPLGVCLSWDKHKWHMCNRSCPSNCKQMPNGFNLSRTSSRGTTINAIYPVTTSAVSLIKKYDAALETHNKLFIYHTSEVGRYWSGTWRCWSILYVVFP